MKKYFYLFFLLFLFNSCADEVQISNPAFQALKDNVFWKSDSFKAYIGANDNLIIEGYLGYEKVVLQTASSAPQIYTLGTDGISKALYSNAFTEEFSEFSTGTNKGNGQIEITDYNAKTNTVSGIFKFEAVNESENSTESVTTNFTEGVFYKIPIEPAETSEKL